MGPLKFGRVRNICRDLSGAGVPAGTAPRCGSTAEVTPTIGQRSWHQAYREEEEEEGKEAEGRGGELWWEHMPRV